MFMMNFQQNITFGGCNPFMMGCFNPRLNFFLGMAGAFAGIQMPVYRPMMPMCGCSIFTPYMPMAYANPYAMSGFGTYQAPQTFQYNPQASTNPFAITPGTVTSPTTPSSSSSTTTQKDDAPEAETPADNSPRPEGMTLRGKGKGSQYGPQFLKKVKQIAKNLNCNYKDLMAIINSESGVNAKTVGSNGASGLICFMPQFFDVAKIRRMSPMEQLDLVEETIRKAKKQAGFADNAKLKKGDLYALIFLPARADREVLCTKGERNKNGKLLSYYESNSALDYNHDGKITKDEMATRIDKKYVSDKTFLA